MAIGRVQWRPALVLGLLPSFLSLILFLLFRLSAGYLTIHPDRQADILQVQEKFLLSSDQYLLSPASSLAYTSAANEQILVVSLCIV